MRCAVLRVHEHKSEFRRKKQTLVEPFCQVVAVEERSELNQCEIIYL